MEVIVVNNVATRRCFGCLCSDEFNLQLFTLRCQPLKAIFQMDTIIFCYLCKRLANHLDQFIQNVQSNQILLAEIYDDLSLQAAQANLQLPISLTSTPITATTEIIDDEVCSILSYQEPVLEPVKIELKVEGNELGKDFEEDDDDDDDDFEDSNVKEEDDYPLKKLKDELELENLDMKPLKKTSKIKKNKKKDGVKKKKKTSINRHSNIFEKIKQESITKVRKKYTILHITEEQHEKEMEELAQEQTYINSTFKCIKCVKGFILKEAYERHMDLHSPSRGRFVCSYCTQRFVSAFKLRQHRNTHIVRYRCNECNLLRHNHNTMSIHYDTKHSVLEYEYQCDQCTKVFNRQELLYQHKSYWHTNKTKVTCDLCQKTFATRKILLMHQLKLHPKDGEKLSDASKRYVCQECGKAFEAPSALRVHMTTHSDKRDYYCVECDKSFKTAGVLKRHLQTGAHVNYADLPFPCEHCDKRFVEKTALEVHNKRVHLNIKPFACDKCDKAYVHAVELRKHKKYNHEGIKRTLAHPCSVCGKSFEKNHMLIIHMRKHTGERPYQCAQCPSKFGQRCALRMHIKLIHLNLTRDGKPKPPRGERTQPTKTSVKKKPNFEILLSKIR